MEIQEIHVPILNVNSEEILILPYDFENKIYKSSSLSFYKFASKNLDINFLNSPELIIQECSGEWIGPSFLVTSFLLSHNSEIISILCSVIANYITDFLNEKSSNIQFNIVIENEGTFKKIDYKGNLEGVREFKNLVNDLIKDEKI